MPKTELTKPPRRPVYPRGAPAQPRPQTPAEPRIPLWTRAVPQQRSFPRG